MEFDSDNGNYIRWQDFGCKQATGDGKILGWRWPVTLARFWVGDDQWQWQLNTLARFWVSDVGKILGWRFRGILDKDF